MIHGMNKLSCGGEEMNLESLCIAPEVVTNTIRVKRDVGIKHPRVLFLYFILKQKK